MSTTLQDLRAFGVDEAEDETPEVEDDDCDCDELNGSLPCWTCYRAGKETLDGEPA